MQVLKELKTRETWNTDGTFVPFEGWAKIEVVVCLMWAVDVLSKILELLCILELFNIVKVVILSGT